MAQAKRAQVKEKVSFGQDSVLLKVRVNPEDLATYRGGQYIIINTGIPLSVEKTLKRAYSIIQFDQKRSEIWLGVKRLSGGLGSNFLCDVELGHEFDFSGPWGKAFKDQNDRPALILASHTGISAGLGFCSQQNQGPNQSKNILVWLRPASPDFLSDAVVRELWQGPSEDLHFIDWPRADQNIPAEMLEEMLIQLIDNHSFDCFLFGDGRVNQQAAEILQRLRGDVPIKMEHFFRKPS